MTRADAVLAAQAQANSTGKPVDVWEHTGDAKHPAQGRFIPRPADADPPRYRWTKVETVTPEDHHA